MIIKDDTAYFKSILENFLKEKSGAKPCTVRLIKDTNEIKEWLKFFEEWKGRKVKYVAILYKPKGFDKPTHEFIRNITDISRINDYWIISWNPNEEITHTGC